MDFIKIKNNLIKKFYKSMKTAIILLAILGTCFSHSFFAESNFICRLCEESIKLIKNKEFEQL